jgi:hypothetical protein
MGVALLKTGHADWHHRQLIRGHYNKRCKIELPLNHAVYDPSTK